MTTRENILTKIPFSGFYCSIHDSEFDREFEYMADSYAEETSNDIPEALLDGLRDSVDWPSAYTAYAKEYAAYFLHEFMLSGEFESMTSPRYYNFETDRIFCVISRDSVAAMYRKVNKRLFSEKCREFFTSRDGFISGYNPDWRAWGALSEWDHNQIYALLLTYVERESLRGEFDEWEIAGGISGNGIVSNAICGNLREDMPRDYWRIYDYLIERARRSAI